MMRRGFVAVMVGLTAALLVGLTSTSIANEIGGAGGSAIQQMGVSLGGVVGMATAIATLLVLGPRRRIGIAIYSVATLLAVGFVTWASGRVPAVPSLVLLASDRAELREFHDGARRVRGIEHPTLGFRLPHPTIALVPSEEMETEMRAAAAPAWVDAHEIWAFETRDHDVSVVIDLSRSAHADRASLDALDRAVTGPLTAAGHSVEREEPSGATGCLRERFTAHLASGGQVDGALFTFDEGARSLRLVVTVVNDGTGDWAAWIDDVSLECERHPAP